VNIETRGTVVEMQARGGTAGVLVELRGGHQVWVPLAVPVLVRRPDGARCPPPTGSSWHSRSHEPLS
jgi:hypothetical protein